jgi:hypothetical protein
MSVDIEDLRNLVAQILYAHFKAWTDTSMIFRFLVYNQDEPPPWDGLPDGVHGFSHDLNVIAQRIVDGLQP